MIDDMSYGAAELKVVKVIGHVPSPHEVTGMCVV